MQILPHCVGELCEQLFYTPMLIYIGNALSNFVTS